MGRAVRIYNWFTFDAAHRLPNVPRGHKCRNLHGHCYRVRVDIRGDVMVTPGWVIDYADIKTAFKYEVHNVLDHRYLNEIKGLENPTAELICLWIRDALTPAFGDMLCRVEVKEGEKTGAIWEC